MLKKSHALLEIQLEAFRVQVCASDRVLKILRIDNEFAAADIRTWAALCTPPIALQPCIPHEHHSIGDIERFNRTLGDTINKKIYGKPHLSRQYWEYA